MILPDKKPAEDLVPIGTEEFMNLFKGKQIFVIKPDNTKYADSLEGKEKKLHSSPWHRHVDDIQECVSQLYEQNESPFNKGIFFTVNELDQKLDADNKRTKKMLENIRAVWADDDTTGDLRDDFPIQPNVIIKTSSPTEDFHKFQYIWLTSTTEFDAWDGVMNTITIQYGGDKQARDRARILRLPGFNHNKKESQQVTAALSHAEPYTWDEILDAFPLSNVTSADTESDSDAGISTSGPFAGDLAGAMNEILNGGADSHGAVTSVAMRYANKGLGFEDIKDILLAQLELSTNKDERYTRRLNQLDNDIRTAINKVKGEAAESIGTIQLAGEVQGGKFTNVDWPPGFMGVAAKEIYEWMEYPNKTIAIASAHILIAIFAGRRNSFRKVDISRTYLMYGPPSIGKNTALSLANNVILHFMEKFEDEGNIPVSYKKGGIIWNSFRPLGKPYGSKAIFEAAIKQLSVVIVQSEGGVSGKSQSGDQSSVKAFLMQQQSSGAYQPLAAGSYSEALPTIFGPPITVLYESTKAETNFDGGVFESGEHGRRCAFHLSHRCDLGVTRRTEFSEEFIEGIFKMGESAVVGEDFKFKVKIRKSEFNGPCLAPVKIKVIHEGLPEVEARLAKLRVSEMEWRNNKPDDFDVDREWVNKTRYEMQVRKECLVLSIADSAAYNQKPVITVEHLNYAEHFQNEINRADEANSSDYSQATDALVDEVFNYCDRQLDPKSTKNKTYFKKHTRGDQKARRIKVAELANATSKHKRIATQLAAGSGIKDKTSTHFVRACLKDGVTKGYWQHIREDKARKGLKEEHLIVSYRE